MTDWVFSQQVLSNRHLSRERVGELLEALREGMRVNNNEAIRYLGRRARELGRVPGRTPDRRTVGIAPS